MEMSLYLVIGLVLSVLLSLKAKPFLTSLTCLYWLVMTLWSLDIISPFSFNSAHWVSLFKANISYHIDGLSQLFVLLISGIGIVVLIYAWIYTQHAPSQRKKLLSLLQIFAISMLGLVIANDMLMLFLCWELTSVISYLLIQFDPKNTNSNRAAFNSLFVCVLGSLPLLLGFIILYSLTGSWEITQTIKFLASPHNVKMLSVAFWLIFCGVITKSAQFPFYFWLTGAMRAPTPVSAYLHSATMVNAGIYLLARLHPLFSPLALWYPVLSSFGIMTMLFSSVLSLFQRDLKLILAYTTIFILGAMVYLLGGKSVLPIEAFAILLLFHGIYKAGTFMLVGTINKEYHTRELYKLDGIARHRLFLACLLIIAFGAMAGLPPFFGFTMKEMLFEAKLATPSVSLLLIIVSLVSSMLIAAASLRCLWHLLKKTDNVATVKSRVSFGLACPFVLIIFVLLFSIIDSYIEKLVNPVIKSIIPAAKMAYMTPNATTSFLLSFITVLGGIVILTLYLFMREFSWTIPSYLKLQRLFESSLYRFIALGRVLTDYTQNQPFNNHLRIACASIIILIFFPLSIIWPNLSLSSDFIAPIGVWLVCLSLLFCSVSLLISTRFLYNLISLSIIGFASTFFFIMNGAVDVGITQILVEILTIIILLIALRDTKLSTSKSSKYTKYINSFISIGLGLFVTILLLNLKTTEFNQQLKNFYVENSLSVANGKNIVNVILVDFRSFDTFGEVIVILATSIGLGFLLKKYISLMKGL